MLGGAGGLGLAHSMLLFSLDLQSFPESHGLLTAHHHPEEERRGQSRGSWELRGTEGGGGIIIDSTYNSSGNGLGALCCVYVHL